MKIEFNNIGILEKAKLEIKGISLVAGKNDAGKSTIGKILYCILRAYNTSESEIEDYKISYFYSNIQSIFRHITRYTEPNIAYNNNFISKYLEKYEFLNFSDFEISNQNDLVQAQENVLNELININSYIENESIKKNFKIRLDELKLYNTNNSDTDFYFKIEYLKYFFEEFFPQGIKNVYLETELSKISIDNFHLEFINNVLVKKPDEKFYLLPKDVIYIESPHQLEKENTLFGNSKSFENYLYTKVVKKADNILSKKYQTNTKEFITKIRNIINGSVQIENSNSFSSNLSFEKEKIEFEFDKIATGIKSFGIIELLLKSNSINEDTLLIIDEPEVHLHPSWQVKFAELLVLLSKNLNIQILLSSHSPYFIEALESFSEKYGYKDQVNFYFANNNTLTSEIFESSSLSEIYNSISEAYYDLKSIKEED